MLSKPLALALLAGGVLFALASRKGASAAPVIDDGTDFDPVGPSVWDYGPFPDEQGFDVPPSNPEPVFDANDARARQRNLRAFLETIATFESAPGDDGYSMLYGGGHFSDFRDHPAVLGWPGVVLPDEVCARAGYGPGCVSTAAGKYQFIRPTWRRLKDTLGLPDFSPASQDRAAIQLLVENGAIGYVESGQFDEAIARVRRIWASMPLAGYGQGEKSMDQWRAVYAQHGGNFA